MNTLKPWENPASAGNTLKIALWTLLLMAVVVGLALGAGCLANRLIVPHQHTAPVPTHLTIMR